MFNISIVSIITITNNHLNTICNQPSQTTSPTIKLKKQSIFNPSVHRRNQDPNGSAIFHLRGEFDHYTVTITARAVSADKHWQHPTQQEQWLQRKQWPSRLQVLHFCWVPEGVEVCEPYVRGVNISVMPDDGSKDQLISVSAHKRNLEELRWWHQSLRWHNSSSSKFSAKIFLYWSISRKVRK